MAPIFPLNPEPQSVTWRRVGRFAHFSDGTILPIISGGDGEDTLTELLARAANVTEQSDEDLAQLDADITAAATAMADAMGEMDAAGQDEALAQIEAAGAAVQSIRAEQESRTAAAEDRAQRAQAALALVRGDEGEDEGEPVDETEEVEEEETPPVVEAEVEEEPEQLAAAAPPVRRPLTRVAARRPAAAAPRPSSAPASPFGNVHIVAAANAPGLPAGQRVLTYDDLARGFLSAIRASKGYRGPHADLGVFTIGRGIEEYPESHRLGRDPVDNYRRMNQSQRAIRANGGLQAALANGLTAAGGICAPPEVRYDIPRIGGSEEQPLRDGFMTRYGATRGGLTTLPGLVIEDLDGSTGYWTNEDDISAADGDPTKDCLRVTCPDDDTTTLIEAAYMCLKYGNFRQAYFPEQIEAWMDLMMVNHARSLELRRWSAIDTGKSSSVTIGQNLGTSRDILAGLDRIMAVWQDVHRTPPGFRLAIALPRKLRNMWRTDNTRQLPVGSVVESLRGMSDEQIDGVIRDRGFEPTWVYESESGQNFNSQGDGPLQGWPSTVVSQVAVPGSWLDIDGGELRLGIMRDTTTTATNDVQFFSETMQASHFFGIESWRVVWDVCSDGSVSGTVDINPCSVGS